MDSKVVLLALLLIAGPIGLESYDQNMVEWFDLWPIMDGDDFTEQEDNEVYHDLSTHMCMGEVENQNNCNSCYVFASMTLFEWALCKHHHRYLPLSKQYIIDCGKALVPGISGCSWGSNKGVAQFVHNFGFFSENDYPYRGVESPQNCPLYGGSTFTNWIQMDVHNAVTIPESLWATKLPHGPLVVTIYISDNFVSSTFRDYRGGVITIVGCQVAEEEEHLVTLVGHGVQNGVQYWKFRNSYGGNWGEQGYFRVAKSSLCINSYANAYGTSDGENYNLIPPEPASG